MTGWQLYCALHFEHLVVLGHKCSDHRLRRRRALALLLAGPDLAEVRTASRGLDASVPLEVREYPEPHPTSVRASLLEME